MVVEKARADSGKFKEQQRPNLHMLFRGAPGTGKTSFAHIIGRLLKQLGLVQKGSVVQARRQDLVGEYFGQTAHRTANVIQSAMGGILFVDEAYSLVQSPGGGIK